MSDGELTPLLVRLLYCIVSNFFCEEHGPQQTKMQAESRQPRRACQNLLLSAASILRRATIQLIGQDKVWVCAQKLQPAYKCYFAAVKTMESLRTEHKAKKVLLLTCTWPFVVRVAGVVVSALVMLGAPAWGTSVPPAMRGDPLRPRS